MRKYRNNDEGDNYAIVEIFGGAFALLLVLFLLFNLISESTTAQRLADTDNKDGIYNISWGSDGEGFVVLSFKDKLHIIENQQSIKRSNICHNNSAFISYAKNIYAQPKQQIIFAILEGGVGTMKTSRDCLMALFAGRKISIGWIIANQELLKAVNIKDIPPHIKKVIKK
jgi:hypothetical protein